MSERVALWSETKLEQLRRQLTGFWAENRWDMYSCPDPVRVTRSKGGRYLKFCCPSAAVNTEIKYACWQKLMREGWTFGTSLFCYLTAFLRWAQAIPQTTQTLLERDLSEWKILYLTHLTTRNVSTKMRHAVREITEPLEASPAQGRSAV
jgi:hypothetical protein